MRTATGIRVAVRTCLAGALAFSCGCATRHDPYESLGALGRGINLGNALEAPAEGQWGVTLHEEYFRAIRDAGFRSVRIPVRWSAHAGTEAPYAIDETFLDRVDWAVDNALKCGLAVVINIHHYQEIMSRPEAERARFLALWRQIAEHYRDAPNTVLFELLNEPNDRFTPELWNEFLVDAMGVVRESNPHRTLIVGTAKWGGLGGLDPLEWPADDNLVMTFHYYEPFHFTHQGASWVKNSEAWRGSTWTGTDEERERLRRDFEKAAAWGSQHGCPVYVGEFGAFSAADMDSRARWTEAVAREAETNGFAWAYWEFCSGFGAYDPAAGAWRQPLLRALIPPPQNSQKVD